MPRKRPSLADLKAEAWAELKRGRDIYEAEVWSKNEKIHGLCTDDSEVFINPKPDIVETILHELTHRRHPRMSEEAVTKKAHRIMVRMTDAEIRKWIRQYKAVARKLRKPVLLEEDEDAA